MKLNFAIICDNAFVDKDGRLSIIQTFDSITSEKFPAVHPRLTVVASYSKEEEDSIGDYKQIIFLKSKNGRKIAELPSSIRYDGSKGKIQLISYFVGLQFLEEDIGNCIVEIELGKEKKSLNLEIRKISKVNE